MIHWAVLGASGDGLVLSGYLLYTTIVRITGFSFPMSPELT